MIEFSIAGILLGFLLANLIAYTVYVPLRRTGKYVQKVSEGDLREKIPIFANDEVGQLAIMVNVMIDNIHELIDRSKKIIESLSQSSLQLMKSSEMSSNLMEDMTIKAMKMSENTTEQAELSNQSKFIVSEMSLAIQQLAENAQLVSTSSLSAANNAQDGEGHIKKAIEQISVISSTVNATADIIDGLGNKTQEIGQIVVLITNIASQTNLLALNAAIEAARAGEQGKGFAVVAEEVRKLAEESALAAQRIAELIKEVQTESGKAVNAMMDGTREVASGTEVVAYAGTAFEQIIKAVEIVNEQAQEMSAASQEMSASTETAMNSIEKTAEVSSENAISAQSISQSTEEQMAGLEEVNVAVERLDGIIQDLENSISKFRT